MLNTNQLNKIAVGEKMKIIAQKSDALNTDEFFNSSLSKNFVTSISFNVAFTKDEKLVIFNANSIGTAITSTINNSTFNELEYYEIASLESILKSLSENPIKKDIYINLTPSNYELINDENAMEIANRMDNYIKSMKSLMDTYKNLVIHLHSVNRSLIERIKKMIPDVKVGFAVTGLDLNFIDVDYYVLVSNTQNDTIIDMLLKKEKEVIIYILSNYYISYLYEHYLGEKSTPLLQQTFNQLAFMTNYPEIIYKVFFT